jgi:hypothetical protein
MVLTTRALPVAGLWDCGIADPNSSAHLAVTTGFLRPFRKLEPRLERL